MKFMFSRMEITFERISVALITNYWSLYIFSYCYYSFRISYNHLLLFNIFYLLSLSFKRALNQIFIAFVLILLKASYFSFYAHILLFFLSFVIYGLTGGIKWLILGSFIFIIFMLFKMLYIYLSFFYLKNGYFC